MKAATLDATSLRRYTIAEIDEMRKDLYLIDTASERYYYPDDHYGNIFWGGGASTNYEQQEQYRSQRVEDRLRTYMIGGIDPADLKKKADDAKAAQKEWYEEQERQRDQRRLQKEYGPRP